MIAGSSRPKTSGADMLKTGILNPQVNHLLSRIRHTNLLVIADRGFPFWPQLETIDLALVDDIPRVLDVVRAVRPNFVMGRVWMAKEFTQHNSDAIQKDFREAFGDVTLEYESHIDLKKRTAGAIGLIRTGDTIPYSNIVLESA
jgi:D-ribose pyranase